MGVKFPQVSVQLTGEDDCLACRECGAEALTMCDEFCSGRWSG